MISHRLIYAPARNGGHLTASWFRNYSRLSKLYDPEEVKRCFALERHTVSTLLDLIEAKGWTEHIDLVDGGHSQLILSAISWDDIDFLLIDAIFFSEKESLEASEDYEKAKEAGIVSKDQVKWFTPEEAQKVVVYILGTICILTLTGIRRVLHNV
jgi:hypothetical protein